MTEAEAFGAPVGYFFAAIMALAIVAALAEASARRRDAALGRRPRNAGAAGVDDALGSHENPLLAAAANSAANSAAAAATAEAPLPEGWERHEDGEDVWFVCEATGESRWTPPPSDP